ARVLLKVTFCAVTAAKLLTRMPPPSPAPPPPAPPPAPPWARPFAIVRFWRVIVPAYATNTPAPPRVVPPPSIVTPPAGPLIVRLFVLAPSAPPWPGFRGGRIGPVKAMLVTDAATWMV